MIRRQVPQITNSHRIPTWFKNLVDEFLDHIVRMVHANRPFLPLVQEAERHGAKRVFLYAPEGGGSSILLAQDIVQACPHLSIILLNDELQPQRLEHFVNLGETILRDLPQQSLKSPVPPQSLVISINQAHRLTDQDYTRHLQRLQEKFDFILIGEGNNKSLRQVIGMTVIVPLVILLMTPLIRPRRLTRFIFTYLLPLLPIVIVWDGIAALFRIRSPELIKSLSETASLTNWNWSAGKLPNHRGGFIIYALGTRNSRTP